MEDPIRKIAETIVDRYKKVDLEIKEAMIKETMSAILRHINAEFIARMNDDQVKEFSELLDTQPDDNKISEFVQTCGIDINEAVAAALASFQSSYEVAQVG